MSNNNDLSRKMREMQKQMDGSGKFDYVDNVGLAVSIFSAIPGLRAFWSFNSFNESLATYDRSLQGRTLTSAGTPTVGFASSGVTYVGLNGTTQYFYRADEAGLDITAGMTFGSWIYPTADADMSVIGKWTRTGNQRSYLISRAAADDKIYVSVSSDGTATKSVVSTDITSPNNWYFVVGRYVPSTELSIFINDVETVDVAAVPASIYSGSSSLAIGCQNSGGVADYFFTGYITFSFISSIALSDYWLSRLFDCTRTLFAV